MWPALRWRIELSTTGSSADPAQQTETDPWDIGVGAVGKPTRRNCDRTMLDQDFLWSGPRDSNPRPSPWQREETRPCGPSSPLMWTSVRPFVRLVRPVRPFRLPVYHRPRQRASTEVNLAQRVPKPPSSNRSAAGRGPCQTSQRLRWARSARSPTNESALDDGCHSTNERSSTRPRARARGGKLEGADRRLWAPLYGDHARSGVRRLSDMRRRSC